MNERRPHSGLLRAFRDRYVASYAGLSYDLAPGAIGVNPETLEQAPDLEGRRVLVSTDHERPTTLDHRPSFIVTPLSGLMKDANTIASQGGLVFSTFDLETPRASGLLTRLGQGETIFLNASINLLDMVAIKRPTFSAT